jgi:hypothetical protein
MGAQRYEIYLGVFWYDVLHRQKFEPLRPWSTVSCQHLYSRTQYGGQCAKQIISYFAMHTLTNINIVTSRKSGKISKGKLYDVERVIDRRDGKKTILYLFLFWNLLQLDVKCMACKHWMYLVQLYFWSKERIFTGLDIQHGNRHGKKHYTSFC